MVTMHELIRFTQHGLTAQGKVIGDFEATGVQPLCLGRFEELGVHFDSAIFAKVGAPTVKGEAVWAH